MGVNYEKFREESKDVEDIVRKIDIAINNFGRPPNDLELDYLANLRMDSNERARVHKMFAEKYNWSSDADEEPAEAEKTEPVTFRTADNLQIKKLVDKKNIAFQTLNTFGFLDPFKLQTVDAMNAYNANLVNRPLGSMLGKKEFDFVQKNIVDDQSKVLAMAKQRFSDDKINQLIDNPITWDEADGYVTAEDIIPFGGFKKLITDTIPLAQTANRIAKGEEVTDEARAKLENYIDQELEKSIRGFTWGGGMKTGLLSLPQFMTEFWLTGGFGKLGQKAVEQALETGTQLAAVKSLQTTVAGGAANIATRTPFMSITPTQYGDITLKNQFKITEDGRAVLTGAKDKPVSTFLKSLAYSSIETASELAGQQKYFLIDPIKNRVASSARFAFNNLPPRLQDSLLQTYKTIKPNATFKTIAERVGYNGMIKELGEERLADVMRAYLDYGSGEILTFEDLKNNVIPTSDQFLVEAALIGTVGAVGNASNIVFNLSRKQMEAERQRQNQQEADEIVEMLDDTFDDMLPISIENSAKNAASLLNNKEKESYIDQELVVETNTTFDENLDAIVNEYSEIKDKDLKTQKKKILKELKNEVKLLKKQTTTFKDFIAEGGALNTNELIRQGIDPATFQNKSLAVGKGLKRVFAKNGTQTLADLAERYNERKNLFNPSVRAGSSEDRTLGESEILELVTNLFYENVNPVFELDVDAEISIKEDQIIDIENMEQDALDDYLMGVYRESTEEFDNATPIYTDVIVDDKFSEGDSIDEVTFNLEMKALQDYVDETEGLKKPEEINQKLIHSNFVDIPNQNGELEPADIGQLDHSQSTFDKFYTEWVHRYHSVDKLIKEATAKKNILPGQDPTVLLSTYGGISGTVRAMIEHKTYVTTAEGKLVETGVGLKPIIESFDIVTAKYENSVKKRKQDLSTYLISQRIINDLQEGLQVTPEQKGQAAVNLQLLEKKYGKGLTFFESTAKEIYDFEKRILALFVQSGNLTQQDYDTIIANNPNYVPFKRVFDENAEKISSKFEDDLFISNTGEALLQALTGSSRDLKDPINSIIANTTAIIDIAARNKIARSIVEMADVMPNNIRKVTKRSGAPTIQVFINGKKEFYELSKPLFDSLKAMDAPSISSLGYITRNLALTFRTAATIVPQFTGANWLRDTLGASTITTYGVNPVDAIKGILTVANKPDLYYQWMASGASHNTYLSIQDEGLEKSVKELMSSESTLVKYSKKPWMPFYDFSTGAEESVRIGIYNKSLAGGASHLEAAKESRDFTDFARAGTYGRILNRHSAFFNAAVQGIDKNIRFAKKHPFMFMARGLQYLTLPSIAIAGYYLYEASDEEREQYLQMNEAIKNTHSVFKVGDQWIRIPRAHTVGYAFGRVPEKFMEWAYQERLPEGEELYELAKGLVASASPIQSPISVLPSPVQFYIEMKSNYSYYFNNEMINDRLMDLEPDLQFYNSTSETAKLIGKQYGVSPIYVEQAINSFIPSLDQYVITGTDYLINQARKFNNIPVPEKPKYIEKNPLIGRFLVPNPISQRSILSSTLFELGRDLKRVEQSLKIYKENNPKFSIEYAEKNKVLLSQSKMIKNSVRNLNKVIRQQNELDKNLILSSEVKKFRKKQLTDQAFTISKNAIEAYDKAIDAFGVEK